MTTTSINPAIPGAASQDFSDENAHDPNRAEFAEHILHQDHQSFTARVAATDVGDTVSHRTSTSTSGRDAEAGFAQVDGEIRGSGYNETNVDIITVPCPGADPIETWNRDPLPDVYLGLGPASGMDNQPALKTLAGDTILTPGLGGNFPKAAHLWVRQELRHCASTARVLLYRHRELFEGVSLDILAQDLLKNVLALRDANNQRRPIFFLAHSIGGLVVKKALLIARTDDRYRNIFYRCHGISFFATPHRGSSYMSSNNLSYSIQHLLCLQQPLPRSIAREITVNNKDLLALHEAFTDIVSEICIWTFYETIDSELAGFGTGPFADDVSFRAPLVSIKSALVGVRQEVIYSSLESNHTNCASFGHKNPRTLAIFLQDLTSAVAKAEALSRTVHHPLKLEKHVKVEIFGFYKDPDHSVAASEAEVRLYVTKYRLAEFLRKGPEKCLRARLGRAPKRTRHRPSSAGKQEGQEGIVANLRNLVSKTLSPAPSEQDHVESPDIVITPASNIMPSPVRSDEDLSAPLREQRHRLTMPVPASSGLKRPFSRAKDGTATTSSDPTGYTHSSDDSPAPNPALRNNKRHNNNSDTSQTGSGIALRPVKRPARRIEALEQDLGTGFSRPNLSQRKFMWVHVPFTNPVWVRDIFNTLSETYKQDFSRLFSNDHWVSRHVQGRHSQSQPSFVKPAVNFIPADSASSHYPSPQHSKSGSRTSSPDSAYLYLYLPYLHFERYRHMVQRRNLISKRMAHGRARPVPKEIANLESVELRVVWKYLGHDPPLNGRRTLDQFGYPSLRDTHARDDDQMLYKLTREDESPPLSLGEVRRRRRQQQQQQHDDASPRTSGRFSADQESITREKEDASPPDKEREELSRLRNGNLLMVDQLWLWVLDSTTLTTFFPKRESHPAEGALFQQADLRNSVYQELNGDLTGRCENALDLAAFVALHATERMTTNLKKFRMQTFNHAEVDSDSDPEDNTTASIKKRHKREIERAEQENRENTSALLELRDMEDELKTLQRLFDTQVIVIGKMLDIYTSDNLKDLTHYGQAYLNEALDRLAEYKTQAAEMLERVAATRGDYEKLLEMAQRQAQVDDVRWSRLQTELASSQNLSVMIFTIFTVIFLPLSFFTSLFGMNTSEWAGSDSAYPTLGFIGAISLPASLILIGATLIAAFSSHVQVVFKIIFRWLHSMWNAGLGVVQVLEPKASRMATEAKKAARKREEWEKKVQRRKERAYDYWATVRPRRTMEKEEMNIDE
ncbi:hypothetical protein BD289DRAFT_377235 [Coniella lustricola]|uniref:DUF676 domain-containing protein n=1 Tax=Coniella lustricola TaxID=2025994 RepID=A0A2T2ZVQ9_9PEZI|nr:hypothetical protein BD289DRAFT_377235 [Coniella lustricola]